MSNIYIQEPPTNGKVLLVTSVGDIDVELWSKEAPKACRNFVQLCLEGYYDGTIFHRVVSGFIAQGGDPTGTGQGGESVYGQPFKDEFHSRLRFARRGLVAMANSGPNDNGSQFFFTLAATPELTNKHTIFGKVGGNTVYNMIKLQECEVDSNERPLFPNKIIKSQVLSNPFDDIIPRARKSKTEETDKKSKSKSKATKNFSLLSFGEEAEEDEEEVTKAGEGWRGKSKSSHDLSNDPKLSAVPAVDTELSPSSKGEKRKAATDDSDDGHEGNTDEDEEMSTKQDEAKENVKKKLKKESEVPPEPVDPEKKPSSRSEELRQEAKKLKKEIKESMKRKEKTEKPAPEEVEEETESPTKLDPLAEFKKERQKYKERRKQQGKKGSSREDITMSILDKFKGKLQAARTLAGGYSDEEPEEEDKDKTKEEGEAEEEEDFTDMSWMHHKLEFTEEQKKKVIDANINDLDRYEIHDPRNPLTKRRREASKQAMKGKR